MEGEGADDFKRAEGMEDDGEQPGQQHPQIDMGALIQKMQKDQRKAQALQMGFACGLIFGMPFVLYIITLMISSLINYDT